jgi:hypothetical protein
MNEIFHRNRPGHICFVLEEDRLRQARMRREKRRGEERDELFH